MIDPGTLALLALAGLLAGFIDAVVGGGGLVQLPALLLGMPGATPLQVLATNKLGSICGTSVSAATYARRLRPDPRTFVPLMVCAFAGSLAGAVTARLITEDVFAPVVLVALIAVGAWTVLRPAAGQVTEIRLGQRGHLVAAIALGLGIGFYDGVLGPGTGSFLVIGLVGLVGYSFLEASASAKLANWATNLAALVVFVPMGAVVWKVGLVIGAANVLGGYLGARTAIGRGPGFVRGFFLVVVAVFVVRIGGEVLGLWG
ncbi:TSUP family transporter [Nocardioidaceae bacterium]|nr:TSUP family transporter [Nocardioidaceae bacterium]